MATTRRAGGITKRCECRGTDGKRLGSACPQLSKRSHGTHQLRQELPVDEEGARRTFRRTGYVTAKDAQKDLDRIRAILDLAADDEDGQRRVGDLLDGLQKTRAPIPEPTEVSRKLGVGVPLDGKMTVAEWLDKWMADKKTRTTTNRGYASHIRVHLKPALGHLRLDRLGVGHVQDMFNAIDDRNDLIRAENQARREQVARSKRGKPGAPKAAERAQLVAERERLAEMPPFRRITGPATKQSIRRTLRAALNKAIARQLITFNAAAHVELESAGRPKGLLWTAERVARWRETGQKPSPVMVWTPAQLGRFLDEAEGDRLYAFFHLVAHHGLRRGEGVGQEWADFHEAAKTIRVANEIVIDGWTPIQTAPKTEDSAATVKIDTETVRVLKEHRARQLLEREVWNEQAARRRADGEDVADWVDTGKMFTAENGAWLHPDVVSKAFKRIMESADLPPINLRDLRHGAAALVKAGGGELHDAKVKLRHSTIVLTSDTYMELFEEYEDELTEKAAAAVPRARKPRDEAPAPVAVPEQGPDASQPADADDDAPTVDGGTDIGEGAA
ncbi:site-specific integrase [Streptomyces scabiei]|uniref:site-specific integrase n=1 Tax=Streptomyces scabiei TaxID=1930 RepID=UPI0029B0A703|nr:tyrosine-type recombinase/integrase [Streptomyces scabiei]MDX2538620.1 tyrosine-type recombinase/integrase [Streptomyces scabiei]MDX2799894.1 tyrosine-type recombinase/integrase [Streptomyces scabiei]MDX2859760.1 tyrosine-type recombinase/integrase [Streptomyces scabiei]MDX3277872.1 tyrosine-type recombinase/integrase [Streptomyces scabiei]MDX3828549.1 tyrosine-type recombinase/integrase [Streptomyces scabiei]